LRVSEAWTDPASLEGDALTQWYLRSPADIEQERQAAAARRYQDFFYGSAAADTGSGPGAPASGQDIDPGFSIPTPPKDIDPGFTVPPPSGDIDPGFTWARVAPNRWGSVKSDGQSACLGLATFAIVVIANWQWVALTVAFVIAERRPALLKDAQWGQPTSDMSFRARFRRGVPERELTAWLGTNKFQIDPAHHEATRTISSLPCNELVKVVWQGDQLGRIEMANAEVSEAGCL
jgi:hypothetical protein